MAKKTSIGVNGVARSIKNIYVGVNGVARKVKAGYIGVNGIARQFFADGWWSLSGLSSSNVIAAYQFKGAASQAESYINLANPGMHTLTAVGTPGWNATEGLVLNWNTGQEGNKSGLNSSSAISVGIASACIRITKSGTGVRPLISKNSSESFGFGLYDANGNTNSQLGIINSSGKINYGNSGISSGCIYGNFGNRTMSLNGTNLGQTGSSAQLGIAEWTLIAGRYSQYYPSNINMRIQAVVLFKVALTQSQILELAQKMNAL